MRGAIGLKLMLLVVGGVLSGCATGPEIRTDMNPNYSMAPYRSFGYFSPLGTDHADYESVLTARLKESARRHLESRGYIYSESDPDLLVNFYANVEDRQELRSIQTGPGVGLGYYGYRSGYYGGWGSEIQTVSYEEGTLTIDLVDRVRKALVWQGQAEGRVSRDAHLNPGPKIDAVVAEILARLPERTAP